MQSILLTTEVILGILLAILILIQHRASGLSSTFGGGGTTYIQRRGAEKVLFVISGYVAAAFLGIALVMMYI